MCSAVVRVLAIARFWDGCRAVQGWAVALRGSTVELIAVVVQLVVVVSIVVAPVVAVAVVGKVDLGRTLRGAGQTVAWRRAAIVVAGAVQCAMWSSVAMPSL